MNIFLNCLRKKAPRPLKHHQRHFSSYRLRPKTQTKHLDRPLRVLDIVGPRRGTTTAGGRVYQNHLRLIQDLLRTDYRQPESSNAVREVIDVVGQILEASAVDIEDPNTGCPGYDAGVLSNALSFCASTCDLKLGVQYHCAAIRSGFVANAYVGSCLVTLYGKCADLENAYMVFEEMPVKNVVSWTALISGFAQELQVDVCLEVYSMMRNSAMKPNDYTFLSLLSACTGSGALGQGRSAHSHVIRMGFSSYVHVANALISMYCKCGSLEDALNLFKTMDGKDVVSWNSMMAGYALHGFAMEAIELFENMKREGVKPDAITFLGVLSSCRHAGLVEQGRNYFDSMVELGTRPELDHYACLVDLLGRAGLIEEARDIIIRMPISPNAVIWGSLLSSCRLHGSVWIGIQAAESRLLLEPTCAATHVLLANLYASAKCWDQVSRVRKLMKDRRLRTNPGYSWIEIKNELHTFRAEDKSNDRVPEILPVMDCLAEHMISSGYVPEVHEEVAFNF